MAPAKKHLIGWNSGSGHLYIVGSQIANPCGLLHYRVKAGAAGNSERLKDRLREGFKTIQGRSGPPAHFKTFAFSIEVPNLYYEAVMHQRLKDVATRAPLHEVDGGTEVFEDDPQGVVLTAEFCFELMEAMSVHACSLTWAPLSQDVVEVQQYRPPAWPPPTPLHFQQPTNQRRHWLLQQLQGGPEGAHGLGEAAHLGRG